MNEIKTLFYKICDWILPVKNTYNLRCSHNNCGIILQPGFIITVSLFENGERIYITFILHIAAEMNFSPRDPANSKGAALPFHTPLLRQLVLDILS